MAVQMHLYLDALVQHFEQPAFIRDDPIAIAHGFSDPRDQETIGLYAALLAWGRRATVIDKLLDLCSRMDFRPYEFVRNFDGARDGHRLATFCHRTFQPDDAYWLTRNLAQLLRRHRTVEAIFCRSHTNGHVGAAIQGFSDAIMGVTDQTPYRLRKHLARPQAGSACKRLCMYLRWMVRQGPVDLGLWKGIAPAQLVLPLDIHSGRQARRLGLLRRKANDWKAALELTCACRSYSPQDPARYDFALFGLGAYGDPSAIQAPLL